MRMNHHNTSLGPHGPQELPKKRAKVRKGSCIRLVVVDLDGTLLDASKVIRPDIKMMVRDMRKAQVRFTIATGRFHKSAVRYARELDLDTPIITSSGAQIIDASGWTLSDLRLSVSSAYKVIHEAEKTEGVLYGFFEGEALVNRPSTFTPRYSRSL
ncbi:MAG TPA: HAD hydrolase family protein, partial [Clostridia bacterium]|nr:HAD hydrolase family protein [Clostridia bacterium]